MKHALETIIDPEVHKLLDSFCDCFGVRIHLYSPEGIRIARGRKLSVDSPYCVLFQKKLSGRNACIALDAYKRKEAAVKRKMIVYQCHAGLQEAVMPIYAGKHLLGLAMMGQFRSSRRMPHSVSRLLTDKRIGKTIRDAYDHLLHISPAKRSSMFRFFSILTNYIVGQRMIALGGNMLLDQALNFINGHLSAPISLTEVARHLYRSESTVSHLFREKLGKTFKQTVIEAKLAKAEELMQTQPGITVYEAAAHVGYDDPFHFSSLFKKYRGHSPSASLRRVKSVSR